MHRRTFDLVAVVAIAAIALVLIPLDLGNVVRIAVSLPLVLVLPGYVLTAALFPGREIGIPERVTLTLGLSLVITVLAGLLLNLFPAGLRPTSWAIVLSIVVFGGSAVAFARRWKDPVRASVDEGVRLNAGFGRGQAVTIGLAVLVVIGAIGIARVGVALQPAPGFTQLWILQSNEPDRPGVRVGIRSMEPGPVKYSLEVENGGRLVSKWASVELQPDEKWEATVSLPAGQPGDAVIEALLYRSDAPDTVYRRTFLRIRQAE